jgi:hypothetical protein
MPTAVEPLREEILALINDPTISYLKVIVSPADSDIE